MDRRYAKRFATAALALLGLAGPAAAGEADLLTNVRQLTFEGRRAGEGYFGRDGTTMIFQSERQADNPFYQMYLLDMETGDVRRVSPGHGKTTCGWVRPDGKRVLFASTQDDPEARAKQQAELDFRASGQERRYAWDYDEHFDIYDFDLAGGAYRNLTNATGYDAEGAYSPDGRLIVFASNRRAYDRPLSDKEAAIFEHDKSFFMDIYVMKADGSELRRLTDTPGYDGGPFFSADGRKIVWRRFGEDGATAEIFTMNVDGSAQTQVTRLGVLSWAPMFHPSGDYIVFATNLQGFGNFELYMVDAEGRGEPVRVTDTAGFDGLPAFSPDGTRLTWTSGRTADKSSQIFIAEWNDAEARRQLGLDGKTKKAGTEATAQPAPMAETGAKIAAADLRLHVSRLASEAMEGRLTGTPGERLATDYVASAFAALGLEPAGDDGYFQSFGFSVGAALGPGNRLEVREKDGVRKLEPDGDWRPLAFSEDGKVAAAEVAFAGYGIVTPPSDQETSHDSYGELDVEGKWVVVLRYLPEDLAPEATRGLLLYSELQYKASVAERRGAVGLIVVSGPNAKVKQELVALTQDPAGGRAGIAALSLSNAAAAALLGTAGTDLKALQDELDGGEAVAGFVLPGVTIEATVDIAREKRSGRNVLARLPAAGGAGHERPAVMVGAHLDHLGRGEISGSLARDDEAGQVHFGADDNASGVAGLLEIAQYLVDLKRQGRLKAKRNILFAAWSGEEMGTLGSSHFAKTLAEQTEGDDNDIGAAVAAYLNMDMIGRLDENLYLQGTGSSPVWTREIERRNVPLGLSIVTSGDSYLPTDATPLYLKGVPVLSAFTGAHSDYSTPRDTADKINYAGTEKIARLMAGIARSLARAEAAPAYVRQERPKDSIGRKHIRIYLGTIPDYAQGDTKGVKLSGTTKGGPAEKAGLKAGDVILKLGETEIGNIYDYVNMLGGLKAGTPVDLVIERDGAEVTLTIVPAAKE
ncbi:MAG: M28 family peptidase [Rhodospirillales bacterium]|nr:M28 family peptidase [Rhodospirillales bacterium]MDH3911740.1 M28 family peptidase [Rhodospirillales bacterium]MDH3969826.1 M28 family peptidase [Rhodospirillales bacterium]